jgi:hypothetical protein
MLATCREILFWCYKGLAMVSFLAGVSRVLMKLGQLACERNFSDGKKRSLEDFCSSVKARLRKIRSWNKVENKVLIINSANRFLVSRKILHFGAWKLDCSF